MRTEVGSDATPHPVPAHGVRHRRPGSRPARAARPVSAVPALTEVVDTRAGRIRASGHLTVQGADLLRGTVETLQTFGHRRITVDLAGVRGADAAGLAALDALREAMSGSATDLVLRSAPGAAGPRPARRP